MKTNRKKIAIDARAISHPQPGGFKTYTENLIWHLLQRDESFQYQLYLDRPIADEILPTRSNASFKIVKNGLPFIGVPFREHISLPYHFINDKADLIHFPCATAAWWSPCPFIITIHDTIELIYVKDRQARYSAKRNLMNFYNRHNQLTTAQRANAIITVSHNSKKDIIRYFKVQPEKVFVTYEAPSRNFIRVEDRSQLNKMRDKFDLEPSYILGIGSADSRKNLKCLIRAYSQLPTDLISNYQLVIVMTHHFLYDNICSFIEKLGLSNRARFLHSVTTQELALLYSGASLFVFPSLYEGFGLPLLEAMACGTPVIAANNSSIPEVVGDAALLIDEIFSEGGHSELSCGMSQVLRDNQLQAFMSRQGMEQAKTFSWERCAVETTKIYEMVLEKGFGCG